MPLTERRAEARSVSRSVTWNLLTQVVTAVSSLVTLPIAAGRLGLEGYGLYSLVLLTTGILQQLDGGLSTTALRYFAISVGAGDRRALTCQLHTIGALMLSLGCLVAGVVAALAPALTGLFHLGGVPHTTAVLAFRVVALLVPLGLLQGLLAGLLQAHDRFGLLAIAAVITRLSWVAALLALIHGPGDLRTILLLLVGVQVLSLLVVAPVALSFVDWWRVKLIARSELRTMISYSLQVQAFNLAGLVNLQLDALIIGVLLPVRDVGMYSTGAAVAMQLRAIPGNAGGPVIARLANHFGEGGLDRARATFRQLELAWRRLTTTTFAIALSVVTFQLVAWMGPRFWPAAVVCLLLTFGNWVNMLTGPLTMYLQVIGRPRYEIHYGWIGSGLNLLLTAALAVSGLYGIVAATAVAQIVSSLYFLRLVRRHVDADTPGFFTGLRLAPAVAGGFVSAVCTYGLLRAVSPDHGVGPLIVVSIGALPGVLGYFVFTIGLRDAWRSSVTAWKSRSIAPLRHAFI